MSKPKTCIRITGTRTGKLRARVEQEGEHRFEVTVGGEKWDALDSKLKRAIGDRARTYIGCLIDDLVENAGIDYYGEEE